jgi:YVTN family beta-propeller protein
MKQTRNGKMVGLIIVILLFVINASTGASPKAIVDPHGSIPYEQKVFSPYEQVTVDQLLGWNSVRYDQYNVDPGIPVEGDYMGWAAFTNDGNRVLLTNRMTDNVTVFDWSTMSVVANIPVGYYPGGIAVTDDYAVVACGFGDEVDIINLSTLTVDEVFPLPPGQQPWVVRVTLDGTKAFVACDISNTCEVFDLTTMTHTLTMSNFPISLLSWGFNSENGRNSFSFTSFVVTEDGNYLITCNRADSMFFFNTATGLAEDTITGIVDGANVALSGDGTQVVAINLTNPLSVKRVDIATRLITGNVDFTGHTYGWATTVGVNGDGSKAFVSLSGNMSGIGRFATGDFVTFSNTYSAFWIGVSPDHSYAISGQNRFSIVDFASETIRGQHAGNSQDRGAVSPVGYRAIGFDYARHEGLYFYDYTDPTPTYRGTTNTGEPPEGDAPRRVAITPDGTKAVVANVLSDNISIIDLATFSLDGIIENCGDRVQNVAITSDSRWAVVCGMLSNTVKIIDLTTNTIVADVYTNSRPGVVSITPDDGYAYVGNISSNSVSVVELDGAASTEVAEVLCGVIGVVWACYGVLSDVEVSPDGLHCLVAASFDDQVRVINTATNTVVAILDVGDFPLQIAYNGTGEYAIVTNYNSDNFSVIQVNGASSSVIGTYGYGDDGPLRLAYNTAHDEMGIGHYYSKTVVNVNPETGAFISRDSYSAYGSLIQIAFDDVGAPIVLTMSDGTNPGHIHYGLDIIPLPASPAYFDFNDLVDKAVVTMPGPDYATIIDWPLGIEEIEATIETCFNGILLRFSLNSAQHIVLHWLIERKETNGERVPVVQLSGDEHIYLDREVLAGRQYHYWITAVLADGNRREVGPLHAFFPDRSYHSMSVSCPSPHPVKGTMQFTVYSPIASRAEITLHAISGSLYSALWKGQLNAGSNEFRFDSNSIDLPSGTYFIKLSTPEHSVVRKITIIR